MSDLIQICGLWQNKTKDGKTYFSGTLPSGAVFMVFENSYKQEEKHPSHILYLGQKKKADGQEKEETSNNEHELRAPIDSDDADALPF